MPSRRRTTCIDTMRNVCLTRHRLCHVDCTSCAAKVATDFCPCSHEPGDLTRVPITMGPPPRCKPFWLPLNFLSHFLPFSSLLHPRARTVVTIYPSYPATAYQYLQSSGNPTPTQPGRPLGFFARSYFRACGSLPDTCFWLKRC